MSRKSVILFLDSLPTQVGIFHSLVGIFHSPAMDGQIGLVLSMVVSTENGMPNRADRQKARGDRVSSNAKETL